MLYKDFKGKQLSGLGFGIMRLPTLPDGSIDEEQTREMVAYAIKSGVNYFDTAYFYLGGQSEGLIGKILAEYPRESFYLATKYPGSQYHKPGYKPQEIFEEQLQKCGVEYFDFYLLHNVDEDSMDIFMNPEYGIIDYFKEQKRLGRIKHFGFSCHAEVPGLEKFLDEYGQDMEFCQIQLNWLDWTLQNAKEKYELLTKRNIPVWVMEPVRGGRLAILPNANERTLKNLRPEDSVARWSFRFLQGLPNVHMVLSGMSNMAQMQDNVATFSVHDSLSDEEFDLLQAIAENLKTAIPCTGCRYCCDGCPQGLDIPGLLAMYNELRFAWNIPEDRRGEFLKEGMDPAACIFCNSCVKACPQHIKVPEVLLDFSKKLPTLSGWKEVCRQRKEK